MGIYLNNLLLAFIFQKCIDILFYKREEMWILTWLM